MPRAGRERDQQDHADQGGAAGASPLFRRGGRGLLRLRRGLAPPARRLATNGPHRLGNILQLRQPKIGDVEIEPPLHLAVGVLGKTDRARHGDALQSRGDIDAVAHKVAVALLDDVAQMNADAKHDAAVLGHAGVALDHGVLNFDRAAHRVDDAAELDDRAVAGALDDTSVMHGDRGIDRIAA